MRFVVFSHYEMSCDFLMRLHAFGLFCDFFTNLFYVLLDNCLTRFNAFCFCHFEISC